MHDRSSEASTTVALAALLVAAVLAMPHTARTAPETRSLEKQLEATPLLPTKDVANILALDVVAANGLRSSFSTPLERETYLASPEGRAGVRALTKQKQALLRSGVALKAGVSVTHYYTKDKSFYVQTSNLTALSAGEAHCVGDDDDANEFVCFPKAPFVWGMEQYMGMDAYETMALRIRTSRAQALDIEPLRESLEVYFVYQPRAIRGVRMGSPGWMMLHENTFGRLKQVLLVDGDEIVLRRKIQ